MRTQTELSLADTEAAYLECRQRIEREGGVALSSIHFTCCGRPDRLEVRDDRLSEMRRGLS